MKLTAILLIGACLQVSATGGLAQTVTLDLKKVPIQKVFTEVIRQTGVSIVYNEALFKDVAPVTIQVKDATVSDVLELCLQNQPLSYSLEGNMVVIKQKPTIILNDIEGEPPIDIKGRVTNENGEPVRATVSVKGTTIAVSTNDNGEFELKGVDENAILVVTGISIETKEIKIGGKTDITIATKTKVTTGEEVLINAGYYNTTKRLATGNISRVDAKTIEMQPVSNPLQAIQGRMPGVYVQQLTGLPGGGFAVQIRGRNSLRSDGNYPLYIVDGVPFTATTVSTALTGPIQAANPLNNINPLDISSIEVLKDADATAIYGSRGANGVVLITTKKGKAGKTLFNLNVYQGAGKVSNRMKLLNTPQYLEMRREAFVNDGATSSPSFDYDLHRWDTTRNTDWQETLLGGTSRITNVQLSLSGGNVNTQFLISGNYYSEGTVFPGGFGMKKGSGILNISHTSTDQKISALVSVNFVATNNKLARVDLTGMALNLAPNAPALYDTNGKINRENSTWTNPLAILRNTHESNTENLITNVNLGYKIMPGLQIKTSLGYTIIQSKDLQKDPLSFYEPLILDPAWGVTASARHANRSVKTWLIEPQAEYNRKIGNGNLNVLIGTTFQETRLQGESLTASGYTSDDWLNNIQAAATISNFKSDFTQYRYNAIFGRVNYQLLGKYLINLTGRRDGSSRFGKDKQFGNFGAVGAAWIFSKEYLIQNNFPFLSYGKIRSSYGTTGSDQIPDYGYLDSYSPTAFPYLGGPGLIPTRLHNADYGWEVNKKIEAAIELGFLKNRILFTSCWYRNRSSNQLVGYSLSGVTGFSSIQFNLPATVQNMGWEFELLTENIKTKKFSWTSSFNLTIPRNKLIDYPGIKGSNYEYSYIVGKPLGIVYKYHFVGIDPQTGLYVNEDVNNDGSISFPEDIKASKVEGQNFFGGLQNTLKFKGVQLDIFFQFVKQIGFNPLFSGFNMPGEFNRNASSGNQPIAVLNRWQKPGDNSNLQKFTSGNSYSTFSAYRNTAFGNSDFSYADASFIRMKNLALSWELPANWLQKARLQSSKIYIQGQNLFTITKYEGLDPENNGFNSLPPIRIFTAGIQVTF